MNPMECDCNLWGSSDVMGMLLGNGHHVNCPWFKKDVGAIAIIESLLKGIEAWGADEDGIHDAAWEAYRKACMIVRGVEPMETQP